MHFGIGDNEEMSLEEAREYAREHPEDAEDLPGELKYLLSDDFDKGIWRINPILAAVVLWAVFVLVSGFACHWK